MTDPVIPKPAWIYQEYLCELPGDCRAHAYIFAGRDSAPGEPDHFRLVESVHGDVDAPRNPNTGQHEDDVALAIDEACCDAIRIWEEENASKQIFGKQVSGRDR